MKRFIQTLPDGRGVLVQYGSFLSVGTPGVVSQEEIEVTDEQWAELKGMLPATAKQLSAKVKKMATQLAESEETDEELQA